MARGRAAYETDLAVRYAIERLLEIIGEASNALSEKTRRRYSSVAWRDVARLRIVLAHHYHRTDPELVWQMAATDVPTLVRSVRGDAPPSVAPRER